MTTRSFELFRASEVKDSIMFNRAKKFGDGWSLLIDNSLKCHWRTNATELLFVYTIYPAHIVLSYRLDIFHFHFLLSDNPSFSCVKDVRSRLMIVHACKHRCRLYRVERVVFILLSKFCTAHNILLLLVDSHIW